MQKEILSKKEGEIYDDEEEEEAKRKDGHKMGSQQAVRSLGRCVMFPWIKNKIEKIRKKKRGEAKNENALCALLYFALLQLVLRFCEIENPCRLFLDSRSPPRTKKKLFIYRSKISTAFFSSFHARAPVFIGDGDRSKIKEF